MANNNLSRTAAQLEPSGTIALFARAREMQASGIDVISLAVGELDSDSPPAACTAGKKAIDDGHTRYTINSGTAELRQALCDKLRAENKLDYKPNQILVSNGSKQAGYNLMVALLNPDDEVIYFSPFYPSYPAMLHLVGAKSVVVPTSVDEGFQINEAELEKAITPKTKLIIVNSPNNPTGVVYSKESFEIVARLAEKHDLWILSDEIYEKIVFDPAKHFTPSQLFPEIHDRTFVVNGFSKNYAMTGWRVGYVAGPKEIITAAALVQSHITNNACSVSQQAALSALQNSESFMDSIRNELQAKRDAAIAKLESVEGLKLAIPDGAFFLFYDVTTFIGGTVGDRRIDSSQALSNYLLEEHHVAAVPGAAFGDDNALRLSFAGGMEPLVEGCKRVRRGLEQIVT